MEAEVQHRSRRKSRKKNKIRTNNFTNIGNILIKGRFVIGLLLLILIVSLNLNGSSINEWNKILSEDSNEKTSDIIFGKSRGARSDEWMVQTPFYLSQAEADYPLNNDNYGLSGQNMVIAYNSPVKDITAIGKPFNWGFFFLGRDRGLSFYWGFKLIALFLLSFELLMILTKRKKGLSALGSFMITFAPAVQWWFMQHVGDLVFFTIAIMVAVYYFFAPWTKRWLKLLMVLLGSICAIGFVLVIFPAHQVIFAYMLIFWLVAVILQFKKELRDPIFIAISVALFITIVGGVLLYFYSTSKEALEATLNTTYPGHRVSTGGNLDFFQLFMFLTNWKLPFKTINFGNQVEAARFYNLFFVAIFLLPIFYRKKRFRRENYLGTSLVVTALFILFWISVGLPKGLAELTLLSYVPVNRALLTFSFVSMLITFWFISVILDSRQLNIYLRSLTVLLLVLLSFATIYPSYINWYLSIPEMIISVLVFGLVTWLILSKNMKVLAPILIAVTVASGFFVNPIVKGTDTIYESKLAKAILKIKQEDPNALWLSEGSIYNFVPALGVHTLNSVRFYPDMEMWDIVDSKGKNEKIYNRYAHVSAYLTAEKTSYKLTNRDSLTVNINYKTVKKLNVKYIVSRRLLEQYEPFGFAKFEKMYGGSSKKSWKVYRVVFNEEEPAAPETPPVSNTIPEINMSENQYNYYSY
ncbi:DUF7657 domain-containing protein [Enterococcus sp. AZ103]|uniref:DUF7657 domain-containing protein n=1 Tax=Enterococcus sp. AZ103 TaxID=2774628 RepID=UPI003F685668